MKRTHRLVFLGAIVFGLTLNPLLAEEPAAATQSSGADLDTLDLESLFKLKVITASKFAQDLTDAPGVLSVMSRDELDRFGGLTLREILERVPGLAGTSAYFTDRSLLAVRGDQTKINGGHILYLINGRPTREILEGGVVSDLLESFPVGALERIEVVKGPGSVLYGSNAFSGVVNLITREVHETSLRFTGSAGRSDAAANSLLTTFRKGDFSLLAAGQFHQRPVWNTTYRFPFVDPLFPETSSVAVQDVALPDRGNGAFVQAGYKGFTLMSSFTEWRGPSFVRGAVGENRWRRGFADLGYALRTTDAWDMNFNATYTRTTLNVPGFPFIGRDSHEVVLEWANTLTPTAKDQLTFGVLYNHVEGREEYYGLTPSITISQGSRHGAAAYAQLDHELLDKLRLIGGVQANKVHSIELSVVPRGGVMWDVSKRVAMKALYSKAFRAPSINETGLNHPGLEGTPGLKPEKVGTFDVQLIYQGSRTQTSVNYFLSKQTDSIVVDSTPARWKYRNLGEATFHGVEFEQKYYFRKDFFLSGSVVYQANHDGNGKNNVTPIANLGAKAGFSYQSDSGLTASIFDVYQGNFDDAGPTLNPKSKAHHLVSSYVRFDLSRYLSIDRGRSLALFAKADNLADRQVWLPDWGGNSGDTIPVHRGRTIYCGFEVSIARE